MISDVNEYLSGILEFPSWRQTLENDKLGFLREIVQRTTFYTYFQNISMSSKAPEERRTPTLEEVVETALSGSGGVCTNHNVFVTLLLQKIGFDADMISGRFYDSPDETHAICLVRLSKDEMYLLDLACALPMDEPIPLHNLPYTGISAGFRYQYRYSSETMRYSRWQLDGSFFNGKYDDPNKESLRYSFTLEPRDYSLYEKGSGLVRIFTDSMKSMFLQCPFLFRCIKPCPNDESDSTGLKDRTYILILESSMTIYSKFTREIHHFSTFEEMIPCILKYFPKIEKSMLVKSIGYFNAAPVQVVSGIAADDR